MTSNENIFSSEIKSLLSGYIQQDELNNFFEKFSLNKSADNGSAQMINKFYAQQLKIEYSFGQERMQLDRTITYAQKVLSNDKFVELLNQLALLCISKGKLNFAAEILNKLLKSCDDKKHHGAAYLLSADVYTRRADWLRSIDALKKADILYQELADKVGRAKCQNMLGVICGEKGNLPDAKVYFEKCLELLGSDEERELAASVQSNIGIILNIQGHYDKSAEYFEKALRYFELVQDFRRVAEIRQNIGMLFLNKNDNDAALNAIDASIEIALEKKLMPVLALSYLTKANILLELNELDASLTFINKALEVGHIIDDKLTIADAYKTKSILQKKMNNFDAAENYLESSLRINRDKENVLNSAEVKMELGNLYGEMGQQKEKDKYLTETINDYKLIECFDRVKKLEEILSVPN